MDSVFQGGFKPPISISVTVRDLATKIGHHWKLSTRPEILFQDNILGNPSPYQIIKLNASEYQCTAAYNQTPVIAGRRIKIASVYIN